jgi:hypothetical protein
MKRLFFVCILSFCIQTIHAQKWVEMMQDPNANFYDIKAEFESYWKDRPYERGKGYKAFQRWAWFVEPRVYPSGDMKLASRAHAYEEYQKFLEATSNAKQGMPVAPTATTSNWTALGPFGSPANGDAGRLQCIRFHPAGTNTIYVGTAAGGLWVSTNNGSSWTTNTDQLASLGVADVAIDVANPSIMYIATGDNDAGDTYATVVLKSTNAGATWNSTGLAWTTSQLRRIGRLLINPLNGNSLLAATSVGMYRSLNAGTTWSLVTSGNFRDAEYKPGDTTVVYGAAGSTFYKSINGGASFVATAYGAPSGLIRISVAVTPADPNYVYILASKSDYSFGGVYRSINAAATFSTMSTTPNIFGWSTNGSDTGGQGWYDIAIGASPTNKNEITIGAVNTWKSTNGGATWTLNSHWYGGGGKPYVHADCHDIQYVSGTTCYAGTDGGIARTTNSGSTWTTINGTMNIAQIYKLGLSSSSASYIVTGHQDNGTNLLNGTNWSEIYGGDGADCFVDWSNNNTIVASYVNGDFQKSTNGGSSWNSIQSGLTGTAAWVAPIVQDPSNANVFYCGYQQVFKSTNKGGSWSQLPAMGSGGDVLGIAIVPTNTNVIYAYRSTSLFKSTNAGATWSSITGSIPVGSVQIKGVAVDNTNANNVYVVLSGYSSGNKVFYSNNGGATWTNYSTGLPNIPVNCIVYKNNSPGSVYIGTDVGVYYRELSMSSWMPYFTGLPNVIVTDMEIYYPTNKLRAATYGRGVWQTDLYSNPSAAPFAFYTTAYTSACISVPMAFTDVSSNSPSSWSWSFPGGSPSSSTLQNPSVTYAATGIYTVTLVSTNTVGTSSPYVATISVVGTPTAASTNTSICAGQNGVLTMTTDASNVLWTGGQTGTTAFYNPTVTTVYTYTASSGACQVIGNSTISVGTPPPTPTVSAIGNVVSSSPAAGYQWYWNGSPVAGATGQTYTATASGWYSVWTNNGGGCQASSSAINITMTGVNELSAFQNTEIAPNPARETLYITMRSGYTKTVTYSIKNTLGQAVKHGKFDPLTGEKTTLDLGSLAEGAYILNLSTEGSSINYKFIRQ